MSEADKSVIRQEEGKCARVIENPESFPGW